jgi:hypothetical protein
MSVRPPTCGHSWIHTDRDGHESFKCDKDKFHPGPHINVSERWLWWENHGWSSDEFWAGQESNERFPIAASGTVEPLVPRVNLFDEDIERIAAAVVRRINEAAQPQQFNWERCDSEGWFAGAMPNRCHLRAGHAGKHEGDVFRWTDEQAYRR